MTDTAISFGAIPKISQLYKDYLYDFDRVARFYETEGRDVASLVARAARVTAQPFARDTVADVLAEQNREAGAGAATFANIERLRQADSVVDQVWWGVELNVHGAPERDPASGP